MRQQADTGIDIVSDGEFSKGRNWAFYIFKRITGIAIRPATPEELNDPLASMSGGQDRKAFAEFYNEYDIANGLAKRLGNRVVVNGPITYSDTQVKRDIANLKAGVAKVKDKHPSLAAFLPVVAPASALPSAKIEHYKDEETYLFALADALHKEYQAVVDAGLYVQIDDAFLPYMHERMVPPMSNADYRRWAQMRVDALNHALKGIPEERSRYHICWGSWNGPHAFDVPLKDIIDLVLQVRVGHYSFEAANPRHAHEWRMWETVKLPPGKILIPGVISHATNIVEHPELVAERIVRLARLVGRENVIGRHRLRLRAEPVRAARSSDHYVGETQIAGRGRADRDPGTMGKARGGVTYHLAGGQSRPKNSVAPLGAGHSDHPGHCATINERPGHARP